MIEQRTSGRFSVLGIIAFVLLAALLLTLAVLSAVKGVRTAQSYANVVRVEDGQTFVVNMEGTEETVTLAGVMTPRPAPEGQQESLDNCLAEESVANLSGMLEPGDSVQLQFAHGVNGPDGSRLALARSGGQVVNIAQVEAGLAVPVPDQPMERLEVDLGEAQETARTEEAGLYSPSMDCTLPGRVAPVVDVLRELPEGGPGTSSEADAQIETVAAAVEQGVTAEKVFATIDPEGTTLSSLAWADDVPRLRQRLGGALAEAEAELASLQSTRVVLLTREREVEAARKAEEARQAELARQREAARQAEIARQQEEAARQAEAARRAEEEARRKAEERASASPTPSPSPSESSSPSPSSQSPSASPSPSPSSSRPSEDDEDDDDD
jgi:endonuclease YncB( thermonuclease family)